MNHPVSALSAVGHSPEQLRRWILPAILLGGQFHATDGRIAASNRDGRMFILLGSLRLAPRPSCAEPQDRFNNREGPQITVRNSPIRVPPIQVDVNMVLLDVTVTDYSGRVVSSLDQSDFYVFDDKVEQQIISFSTEDTPLKVGMILDSSGSMKDKLQQSGQAVLQFFKTANPQDGFNLISFSERVDLVSGFTSKFEDLQARLLFVRTGGRTALLDAI